MATPKPNPADFSPLADLSFEQAQDELESIIARVEAGEVGLEESITQYERGVALLAHCKAILDKAEQRFTELTAKGEVKAAPAASPSAPREPGSIRGQ